MQQIQTPTVPAPAPASLTAPSAATPPPLPLPGTTGGREDVPGQQPTQQRPSGRPATTGSCASALGSPLRTYLVFMAFFTVLWAVGGGGHFWPVWPMLGWGMGLVISGQVPVGGPRRPTS